MQSPPNKPYPVYKILKKTSFITHRLGNFIQLPVLFAQNSHLRKRPVEPSLANALQLFYSQRTAADRRVLTVCQMTANTKHVSPDSPAFVSVIINAFRRQLGYSFWTAIILGFKILNASILFILTGSCKSFFYGREWVGTYGRDSFMVRGGFVTFT